MKREETITVNQDDMKEWSDKRAELIEKSDESHFSNDINIDAREQKAQRKLIALRK